MRCPCFARESLRPVRCKTRTPNIRRDFPRPSRRRHLHPMPQRQFAGRPRVRYEPRMKCFRALALGFAMVGCGATVTPAGDAAPSETGAPASCMRDTDCTSGHVCAFPIAAGCAANGSCVPRPTALPCNAISLETACGCDGTTVHWTGGCAPTYPMGDAPAPIRSMQACP